MKRILTTFTVMIACLPSFTQEFEITDVYITKNAELNQLIFTIEVAGLAGDSVPIINGTLDGAPVLGYVFPTTLSPLDVGFDDVPGIVSLALTSHPDFDDTPLWDENLDMDYNNDGLVWHSHWVVLEESFAVPAGLAVKATDDTSVLPPTNPGMPMYMDSPGFPVLWSENKISCTVPLYRMNNQDDFNYDGVTAKMVVNTSDSSIPLLGVYEVFTVASGDLSLPYSLGNHSCDTLTIDISSTNGIGLIDSETITLYPNPTSTEIHLDMSSGFNLGDFEIQIFDLNSSLVYQNSIDTANMTIPVSEIGSNGTYVLQIINIDSAEVFGAKQIILE